MTKQLSNCCKAGIKLTGSPNHEDGFACEKCGRIIGTPLSNQPIEEKCEYCKAWESETGFGKECKHDDPIEEKWKWSWQWRSDRMGLDKDQHDEIFDFIENLLEQERQRMSEEVEKFMPADREVNYHSSYSEGKIDMAEKILSIINK